jgi:prepilin-type N-terminal cleavage/methylation domain-containing protein
MKGFTILEIIISLIILGGCVAALGELSRNAYRNAKDSREMVQAELLAESILAKVRLGIIEKEPAVDQPITASGRTSSDEVVDTNAVGSGNDALWLYTLEVAEIDEYGLLELAVTVRQNLPEEQKPVICRLVRWFAEEPIEETETGTTSQ